MSRYKNKVKPVQAAGYRVSGVSSNLGKVCREVRGQFRGQFIKGMSQEGCLAIGSQVDLETRSESRRMESAAEISQVSTLMALNAFLGHGRFTSKALVPRSPSKGKGWRLQLGGAGGGGHVAHAASFTSTRMAEGPESSQKSCTAAFSLNSCHWLDAKFLFIHSSQFVPASRET